MTRAEICAQASAAALRIDHARRHVEGQPTREERRHAIRSLVRSGLTAPEILVALQLAGVRVGLRSVQKDLRAIGGAVDGRTKPRRLS